MSTVIEFQCPHCSQSIRAGAQYAGKHGACPHCGKMVTIEGGADQMAQIQMAQTSTKTPSGTHANTLVAALIGAGITIVLYAIFLLVRQTYIGQLFVNRGPIPPIVTFITGWGLSILVLKFIAVKRQLSYAENELDLLPLETGMQITSKNVDMFLGHINGMPDKAQTSILGRRIHGALEHFQSRNSVPEVQAYLASHGEIDQSSVDSGYSLLKSFIWVIPILGFIGTVMGISTAVGGLASSLDTPSESTASAELNNSSPTDESSNAGSQMIEAMGLVTQGLATAFDTTFLALVMAIILLFPTEALKKIEITMLDRIEAFTNKALLRRMGTEAQEDSMTPEIAKMLEPAFRKHQQWLVEWQNKISELGNMIGSQLESHADNIRQKLASTQHDKAAEVNEVLRSSTEVIEKMTLSISELKNISATAAGDWQSSLASAKELQDQIIGNTESMNSLAARLSEGQQTAPGIGQSDKLEQAIDSLNQGVHRLVEIVSNGASTEESPMLLSANENEKGFWPFRKKH